LGASKELQTIVGKQVKTYSDAHPMTVLLEISRTVPHGWAAGKASGVGYFQ
jgi:hypothetical protein